MSKSDYNMGRRTALYGTGAGLGSIALSAMLQAEEPPSTKLLSSTTTTAKAKRCIFLMMEGGPSHIDTFDPKPELTNQHLKQFERRGDEQSAMSSGKRYYVKSPFDFIKAGQSGADICTEWVHLKENGG